jgi:hypothetical protein
MIEKTKAWHEALGPLGGVGQRQRRHYYSNLLTKLLTDLTG